MSTRPVALIILAAGQGTRMNSDLPKVLHPLGGVPMIEHSLASGLSLEPARVVVITGHGADQVEAALADHPVICIRQNEQLGTGHAVAQARAALADFAGDAVVLFGDTPFVSEDSLTKLIAARADHDVVVLGFEADTPARYGRLVTKGTALNKIVEAKDATPDELAITLCNSGLMAADAAQLFDLLEQVDNANAAGEYYLTDVPALAHKAGLKAGYVTCTEAETLGINSRAELARAEGIFQATRRAEILDLGVTMHAPETVYFAHDTYIGRDAVIEPYVVFGPNVTVESGAHIRAFSHLEGAHVSQGAVVGPYARLRPGAEIDNGARIGNFVEVKSAQIQEGAKVNHLSYIGDATIGEGANIGAGTITCNYDGVFKHHTEVGARAFIGSNTMLVAPVTIGADALTASGSVITENVPEGALAVARGRQENKAGLATRLRARLLALKEKTKKG